MSVISPQEITLPHHPVRPEPQTRGMYRKSGAIYFDDGDLVILANYVAFRVHYAYISMFSHVLWNVLNAILCLKPVYFDGVRAVQFHQQINNEMLSIFFETIYGVSRFFSPLETDYFHAMTALLQFTTYFQVLDLRVHAINVLSISYPTTLEQWDAYLGYRHPPAAIITLARETDAIILLPAAFYHLCYYEHKDILLGPPISAMDMALYSRVRGSIAQIWPRFIQDENNIAVCQNEGCQKSWRMIQEQENTKILEAEHHRLPDPLAELARYGTLALECPHLCRETQEQVFRRVATRRQAVWNALPEIFCLSSWKDFRIEFSDKFY